MLARSFAVGALVLAGCYDLPTPVCGFACASQTTTCPDGYACKSSDNRCHLLGYMDVVCPAVPDDPENDFVAPQLQFWGPRSLAEPINTAVSIQFDERVIHVDGTSFYVTDDATGSVLSSTVMSPTGFQWNLNATFAFGGQYTVHVTPDITDARGNAFAGFEYQFGIVADVPPTIDFAQFNQPLPEQTNVSVGTFVTVTMSELVTTLAGKFHLYEQSTGFEVQTVIDSSGITQSATLDPIEQLQPLTRYNVAVDADVTDLSNTPAGIVMGWSFTTGDDLVPPAGRETIPKANSVAAATTSITVLFDEPVTSIASFTVTSGAFAATGALVSNSGGRSWTFTPTAELPHGAVIDVAITDASDASGNLTSFSFSFTTAP